MSPKKAAIAAAVAETLMASEAADQSAPKKPRKAGTDAPKPEPGPAPQWPEVQTVGAWAIMEKIVMWVRLSLPDRLGKFMNDLAPQLHMTPPLEIQSKLSTKELGSYKQPWGQDACANALETTAMYEAGANALWLNPGLPLARFVRPPAVHHEQPSVETVTRAMAMFFSRDAMWSSKALSRGRLVWPLTMEAFGCTKSEFHHDDFNSSISLLGGQAILLAWYGALHGAMVNCDEELLRLLWECGLTMTLQVQDSSERWQCLGH
jgi:hypothetical protein